MICIVEPWEMPRLDTVRTLLIATVMLLATGGTAAAAPLPVETPVQDVRGPDDPVWAPFCLTFRLMLGSDAGECGALVTFNSSAGETYYLDPWLRRESNGCEGFQQDGVGCEGGRDYSYTLGDFLP